MTEQSAAWSDVGAKLNALGQKLRTHFEQARRDEPATPVADAPVAPVTDADAGAAPDAEQPPADDTLQRALRKLGDAIDDVIDAVGATVKDPAVKADVKDVGSSLSAAISKSVEELSTDLRNTFSRSKSGEPPTGDTGPTGTEPTAEPRRDDPPTAT